MFPRASRAACTLTLAIILLSTAHVGRAGSREPEAAGTLLAQDAESDLLVARRHDRAEPRGRRAPDRDWRDGGERDGWRRSGRSPVLAGTLSLLMPGAGQFYNHQPGKGAAQFLLGGAGYTLAIVGFANGHRHREFPPVAVIPVNGAPLPVEPIPDFGRRRGSNEWYKWAGLGFGAGITVWSVTDAVLNADRGHGSFRGGRRGYSDEQPGPSGIQFGLAQVPSAEEPSVGLAASIRF